MSEKKQVKEQRGIDCQVSEVTLPETYSPFHDGDNAPIWKCKLL